MNVGTTPMFAIPFAMISSLFAMIVSPSRKPSCNQFAHACPMIAIPPPDVCRSLQIGSPKTVQGIKDAAAGVDCWSRECGGCSPRGQPAGGNITEFTEVQSAYNCC